MPTGVYDHSMFRGKPNLKLLGCKHTEEHNRKVSLGQRGQKHSPATMFKKGSAHPNWKGGISSANETIRGSIEYKEWRRAVFARDDYTCVWCGCKKGGVLNADHIKSFAEYPALRFDINNGRTLCVECHKKTDTFGWKKSRTKGKQVYPLSLVKILNKK